MNTSSASWDKVSCMFNTHRKGKIDPCAADNILIAWPVFLKVLKKFNPPNQRARLKVLDFGCGTGGFCNLLNSKGFKVSGIDFSKNMIKIARRNSPKDIQYKVGEKNALRSFKTKFNIVTSVMVFQFVKALESYAPIFNSLLEEGGMIIFAVFNPDFIQRCQQRKMVFTNLNRKTVPPSAKIEMKKGVLLTTYVRAEKEYKKIFERAGFHFISSHFPPFTKKFVFQYNWRFPSDVSEYLIMVFEKRSC